MTTSMLVPLLPEVGTRRVATVLEQLEEEVRHCGAYCGILIDRAGQVVAADMPGETIDREQLAALAVRLVPVFLAGRMLAQTFQDTTTHALIDDGNDQYLVAVPIRDQWLLALGFTTEPAFPAHDWVDYWHRQFADLVPSGTLTPEQRRASRVVVRDSVNLIFREEQREPRGAGRSGG